MAAANRAKALRRFSTELRMLRLRSGSPSLREIRKHCPAGQKPAIATIGKLFAEDGKRAPRWDLIRAVVIALAAYAAESEISLSPSESDPKAWRTRHEQLELVFDEDTNVDSIDQRHRILVEKSRVLETCNDTTPTRRGRFESGSLFASWHTLLKLDLKHDFVKEICREAVLHKFLRSGFGGWTETRSPSVRSRLGILHSIDVDTIGSTLTIMVQSQVPPDWSRINNSLLLASPAVSLIEERLERGYNYRFRTVINPSRAHVPSASTSTSTGDGDMKVRSKRVDIGNPEGAREWFRERLQPLGESTTGERGIRRIGVDADPTSLLVRILPKERGVKIGSGIRVSRAEIRGRLEVTDPATFAEVLKNGLGHARMYGCGLILVQRIE
ncbi:type I-E CRISPR-associated protein Cas6/Cse3/CasE [Nocardia rhizosphaerihabitans]|uniref:type I-E CRISPR-associated protein Cas6/Cse3/CasE n=1 Tax=Nocardia rhizosphaerihabitans TaxID=1691570 RepID=UPI00366B6370